MFDSYKRSKEEWLNGSLLKQDGAAVEKKVDDWWVGAYRLMKTFGDDYPEAKSAAGELREQTDAFKKIVPIISTLATPALRERLGLGGTHALERAGILVHFRDPLLARALADVVRNRAVAAHDRLYDLARHAEDALERVGKVEVEIEADDRVRL